MTAERAHPLSTVTLGAEEGVEQRRLVFLHGLFGRGRNFTTIAKGLQPDYRSLLVDLPNHGRSPWTEDFDYIETADAVAEEISSGIAAQGPVDVLGHSMGGKVAMILALRHPDLVDRLVVEDVAPVSADRTQSEFEHLLDSLAELDLERMERRSDADAQLAERVHSEQVRGFLLQNLRFSQHQFSWQPNLQLLRRELPAIAGFPDLSGHTFTGPVLWVAGERSAYVRDETTPTMRALFPKVHKITVRGASHWVHSDRPAEFIEVLRAFLLAGR